MRLCPADIGTTNSVRNIKNCIYWFIKCYGVVIMKNGMKNSSSTLFFLLRSFPKCTHLLRAIKSDKVHYLEYAIDLTKSCKIFVPACKLLFKSTVRYLFFVVVSTSTWTKCCSAQLMISVFVRFKKPGHEYRPFDYLLRNWKGRTMTQYHPMW